MTSRCFAVLVAIVIVWPGRAAEDFWPSNEWNRATPAEVGLDSAKLEAARDYALSTGGSGYITRHGKLLLAWGDVRQRYDLKSSTKSFGSIALGLAVKDGKVRLGDLAGKLHPALGTPPEANTNTGWPDEVTLLHLASQTAGFEKPGMATSTWCGRTRGLKTRIAKGAIGSRTRIFPSVAWGRSANAYAQPSRTWTAMAKAKS
jgi:CubicO group peptidase (beta-lactamase class C family)